MDFSKLKPAVDIKPLEKQQPQSNARLRIGQQLNKKRFSVFYLGDPIRKAHATGFLVSKNLRLLVTNAHVADFQIFPTKISGSTK